MNGQNGKVEGEADKAYRVCAASKGAVKVVKKPATAMMATI